MTDLGFPRWGKGVPIPEFGKIFAENYMKMKEIERKRGASIFWVKKMSQLYHVIGLSIVLYPRKNMSGLI